MPFPEPSRKTMEESRAAMVRELLPEIAQASSPDARDFAVESAIEVAFAEGWNLARAELVRSWGKAMQP